MNKKFGISIIVGVIILSCILSVVGIAYTTFSDVYAATRKDFSFAIVDGKVKTYKFPLEETFGFNMILPEGVTKNDITFSEKSNAGLLKIEKGSDGAQGVQGVKLGKGTLIATITVNGKKYETSTTFEVIENDFSFPVADKVIKQYVDKNALVVGEEKTFKLNLPDKITMDDVEYAEQGNTGLLEIDNVKKTITPKKEGKGVLVANIKETDRYVSVEFEVIAKEENSTTSNNKNNTTSSSNKNTTSSKKAKASISFSKTRRIITYNGKDMIIYESPITSGIKSGEVTFKSSDEKIAKVEQTPGANQAKITIKKAGTFTLTASYEDIEATREIVIYPKNLEVYDISNDKKITDTTITLNAGEKLNISMKEYEEEVSNERVEYTSSSGKVCSVDENGNIQALAKGTTTIKGKLKDNNKSSGQIIVKVSESKEEKMQLEAFSFPIDPETNKIKVYKGKYAFVAGESYTFDMIVPEGAENYDIEYSTNVKDMLEVTKDGKGIKFMKTGSGTLTAKIVIGNKTKTAKTKFEVVSTMEEKEQAGGTEVPYINLSFAKDNMVIEKGNSVNLDLEIDTNIPKKDYELVWNASKDGYVEISKTGRVTALKAGKVDVFVSVKGKESVSAKISLEIEEEVTLVSSLSFVTNLPKKGSSYLVTTNEAYTMDFNVLPSYATLPDYVIEVEDTENFIVDGKTVIALNPGLKTKLTARALDSGNKSKTITIESVISDTELANLQSILENNEITIKLGETLRFRNLENISEKVTISRTGSNFIIDYDEELVEITAKRLGNGKITIKYADKKIEVPINVVNDIKEDDVLNPVKDIILPIDSKTAQTKDYVNDYPLQVGKFCEMDVSVVPENATNKDVIFTVSDNSAFQITSEGKIVANEPNKTATLTVTSVSNPSVSKSIKIASIDSGIKSIKFAKDYVGEHALTAEMSWGFNLIIELTNGTTYDPVLDPNIVNNNEYKRLLNQIVITSSDENLVKIIDNGANVVRGINGKGTLTAYVSYDNNIKATAKFESIGIDENEKIRSVRFAKANYNLPISEGQVRFLPIIELTTGRTLDPSKDYDDPNGVATTQDYKNYLSQLKLVNINASGDLKATQDLVSIVKDDIQLVVKPEKVGKCELGVALKDSSETIAKTKLEITNEEKESSNKVTGTVEEIDRNTTTDNKNLSIKSVQFAKDSYVLKETYSYGFKPIIKLSDGTELSEKSENQEVYKYYITLTDFYLVNNSNQSEIDFGVVEILNDESPKALVPLKNGKITLAVGLKSSGITCDTTEIEVNLNK